MPDARGYCMGRRIADDVGEALDRVDSLLSLTATDDEQDDAVIRALDVVIAPKSPLVEAGVDVALRVLVRRLGRIIRRRVRA